MRCGRLPARGALPGGGARRGLRRSRCKAAPARPVAGASSGRASGRRVRGAPGPRAGGGARLHPRPGTAGAEPTPSPAASARSPVPGRPPSLPRPLHPGKENFPAGARLQPGALPGLGRAGGKRAGMAPRAPRAAGGSPAGARSGAAPGEGRREPSYLFASSARPGGGPGASPGGFGDASGGTGGGRGHSPVAASPGSLYVTGI